MSDPEAYRCAECRHGRYLTAWAAANIQGKLGADGDLDTWDYTDTWGVFEDSIECSKHPSGVIERQVDGQWCRWWQCAACKGTGRTNQGEHWRSRDGYPCPAEGILLAGRERGVHEGWIPLRILNQHRQADCA